MKNFRKLATGHSRNYLVTIGNLGYLKLVKSDMYPKFLKINLVVVVRHSVTAVFIAFDVVALRQNSSVL